MSATCPCCGGTVESQEIYWNFDLRTLSGRDAVVRLTQCEADIIDALWNYRSRKLFTAEQLAGKVWAGRIDGGPEAFNTLFVQIMRLRDKIAALGLSIPKSARGRGYCLIGDLIAVPRLKDAA